MNTILFDLDGTLIDSSEGIIKCVLYTLDFYGIKEPDTAKLYRFIGPPLSESFERYYGFSHEKAYEAVQKYRERYNTTGIFECKLYPGVEKCIRTLKEQGYRIGMASSKPEVSCKRILEHFGILPLFDDVVCNLLEYLTQRDIQTKNSGVNVRYRGKHRFFKGFNEFIKEKTRRCDNDFEKIERHVFF